MGVIAGPALWARQAKGAGARALARYRCHSDRLLS